MPHLALEILFDYILRYNLANESCLYILEHFGISRRHPSHAVTINYWFTLFEIIILCSTYSNAATSLNADTYTIPF